jgi:hypothetical protein
MLGALGASETFEDLVTHAAYRRLVARLDPAPSVAA